MVTSLLFLAKSRVQPQIQGDRRFSSSRGRSVRTWLSIHNIGLDMHMGRLAVKQAQATEARCL